MLEPEVETRPWAEQFELDNQSFHAQIDYLIERSRFYRDKLQAAGLGALGLTGETLEAAGLRE
jgi:hypothetical protein